MPIERTLKKISAGSLLAGAALAVLACNEKPAPRNQSEIPVAKAGLAAKPAISVSDSFKTALGNVFAGYDKIRTSLAQDDLAGAKAAFSSMHAILHMMPKEGLDSSGTAYWEKTDPKIMDVLHPMATAATLEETRGYFMEFTSILSEAIDTLGISGTVPILRFHCPMAKEGKGADWLQKDSVPANPYFGKAMSTCGSKII